MLEHQIGKHQRAAKDGAPEQQRPDIKRDEPGEQAGEAPQNSGGDDQRDAKPALCGKGRVGNGKSAAHGMPAVLVAGV